MSEEADLAVVNDLSGDTPHQIEAHFGMGSPYHQHFGVYADGIALSEVTLPLGWEGRVRTEQFTDGPDDDNSVALLFPEIHDLCASKLTVAVTGGFGRRSDREFVGALIDAACMATVSGSCSCPPAARMSLATKLAIWSRRTGSAGP